MLERRTVLVPRQDGTAADIRFRLRRDIGGNQGGLRPVDSPKAAETQCHGSAALGAKARFLVTFDKDLLVLQKPFGVCVITPAQLLKAIRG